MEEGKEDLGRVMEEEAKLWDPRDAYENELEPHKN